MFRQENMRICFGRRNQDQMRRHGKETVIGTRTKAKKTAEKHRECLVL